MQKLSIMQDFDEYIRQGEPSQKEKAQIWQTAIGLQDVDGLKVSDYLIETAKENIEGKITIDEVKYRVDSYYKQQTNRATIENRTDETDKLAEQLGVSVRTVKRELKRLKDSGQIERIDSDKTGKWKIVKS